MEDPCEGGELLWAAGGPLLDRRTGLRDLVLLPSRANAGRRRQYRKAGARRSLPPHLQRRSPSRACFGAKVRTGAPLRIPAALEGAFGGSQWSKAVTISERVNDFDTTGSGI